MALVYLGVAWLAGIYLGSRFACPPALVAAGLAPLSLLFFFRGRRRAIILASLCLLALLGGAAFYQTSLPADDTSQLSFYIDEDDDEIKGMVGVEPEVRDRTVHLRLTDVGIKIDEEWHNVAGDVLIFAPRSSTCTYGDILLVKGVLGTPPELEGFDYQGYLAQRGIVATMTYPELEVLASGQGFKPLAWLYGLRSRLSLSLARALPEPQASLTQGVVLGIRYNIPQDIREDFNHTGTAHLLAISGVHLSIVAGILLSLGVWLLGRRRYIYIWLALGTIWFYVLLTGVQPPVVRGAVMASLFLFAELLGRQRTAATSLVFAAAVMVGFSPRLLWDVSFQLSFAAMAGLIFLAPPLQGLGRKVVGAVLAKEGWLVSLADFVADSFGVTLAATIAVWPLIALYFGLVPLAGLPATCLAMPALPAIIVSGMVTGVAGLFAPPLALVLGWATWLFTSYLLLVVNVFVLLGPPAAAVGSVPAGWVVAYYAALAIAIWLKACWAAVKRQLRRLGRLASRAGDLISRVPLRWALPPLLLLAVLSSAAAFTMPGDRLRVFFLDVGQGDAILVQKGSQQVLIDGGPSPQALARALGASIPFWDRTIELVVLTHPHADHYLGLQAVFERYEVEQVIYSAVDDDSRFISEGDNAVAMVAGCRIDLGDGVVMDVLNPPSLPDGSAADNDSLVLRLAEGSVSFLFTGDIGWETEYRLAAGRTGLASTVLKVAHHGSANSTAAEFLAAVAPELAVISVGENTFGHPHPETVARLGQTLGEANVFRTDEAGTVEFITDGERLWVRMASPRRP